MPAQTLAPNGALILFLALAAAFVAIPAIGAEEIKGVNPPPKDKSAPQSLGRAKVALPEPPAPSDLLLSVKAFGAVGDGKADDTGALQKAIYAAADNGRSLFIPNGTYRVMSTLKCAGLPGITGEKYTGSCLQYEGEGYCLDLKGALYAGFRDFTVTCTKKDKTGKFLGSGILIGNADSQEIPESGLGNDGTSDKERSAGLYFVGVMVSGGRIGVRIDGGCWINYYYQLRVQGCDVGIYLGSAANSNDFFSPVILANRIGVQVAGALFGVHFFGGLVEDNHEHGFAFTGPLEKASISISGMYFENICNDILVDGKVLGLSIRDCYIAGYWPSKKPVLIHTNKHSSSGIAFRDNFVYLTHQPVYADLNGASIIVENSYVFAEHVKNGTVLTPTYEKTVHE